MNGETNMSLVGESTTFDLHDILRINMMMLDVYVRFLQEPTITNIFGRGLFASIAVANEGFNSETLTKTKHAMSSWWSLESWEKATPVHVFTKTIW